MGITESEYSCMLATAARIRKRYAGGQPPAGSPDAERLELLRIKCRWYEWERTDPPAGSTPPESDRLYALLDRMFTPPPERRTPGGRIQKDTDTPTPLPPSSGPNSTRKFP